MILSESASGQPVASEEIAQPMAFEEKIAEEKMNPPMASEEKIAEEKDDSPMDGSEQANAGSQRMDDQHQQSSSLKRKREEDIPDAPAKKKQDKLRMEQFALTMEQVSPFYHHLAIDSRVQAWTVEEGNPSLSWSLFEQLVERLPTPNMLVQNVLRRLPVSDRSKLARFDMLEGRLELLSQKLHPVEEKEWFGIPMAVEPTTFRMVRMEFAEDREKILEQIKNFLSPFFQVPPYAKHRTTYGALPSRFWFVETSPHHWYIEPDVEQWNVPSFVILENPWDVSRIE